MFVGSTSGPGHDLERNLQLHLGKGAEGLARVPQVLKARPAPPAPVRVAQRLAAKARLLDWERNWLRPLVKSRREILGAAAAGPPRFLVRVDEFPASVSYDDSDGRRYEASRRLHEVMSSTGVSHLMAVLPEPANEILDPRSRGERRLEPHELELLQRMRDDGVTFGQHGATHRTLHADPRRHSELLGLDASETVTVLDRGRDALRVHGVHPRVFVPPFNRISSSQWPLLAERFDVICGGPESIALLGYKGGPLWHGDAVYLPCYAPLYGYSGDALAEVERMIEMQPGTWIPLVLHTAWETDDGFRALQRLAELIAPYSYPWDEFLADVDRSRDAAG